MTNELTIEGLQTWMWATIQGMYEKDAEIARLSAELEKCREDAERYRWLVDNCQECPDELGMGGQLYFGTYSGMDGLDFAIDAARSKP